MARTSEAVGDFDSSLSRRYRVSKGLTANAESSYTVLGIFLRFVAGWPGV